VGVLTRDPLLRGEKTNQARPWPFFLERRSYTAAYSAGYYRGGHLRGEKPRPAVAKILRSLNAGKFPAEEEEKESAVRPHFLSREPYTETLHGRKKKK